MKWVIIKGVRYPISVVSAFAAYYGDNPFLKIRIRNKYHIIYFDNMDYLNIQIRYLINNYPDFVQIGNWYISKKQVMSWGPKGQAVDGSGWVISFTLSFGLENSTQIKFDKEEEYQRALDSLKVYHMLFDIGSDFESVIRMLYSFRNGPKSGIKVADPEDNYEWTNKDGNEKYSTKNLPKAHFRWDWRRYTLSKESVDKITEFVDTILES